MTTAASAPSQPADIRAERLKRLPPFLFNEIDRRKLERIAAGADVINLGVGDPDRPTPDFVIEAMNEAMRDPVNHRYPDFRGMPIFRHAAARFMERRFGVKVDPDRQILVTIGGKDGISHLPLGVVNPGDVVCVPVPAYPVYAATAVLAGGLVHELPTGEETAWLPRMEDVPAGARLLWTCYPNNPTGASADAGFYRRVIEHCRARGIVYASDLAYSEVYFEDSGRPVSMLQPECGADLEKDKVIEFHSLSKSFNMTGWRLGFAVGNADVIAALRQTKDNYDSGPFNAIQVAGAVALDRYGDPAIAAMRDLYHERRDIVVQGLRAIGCLVHPPKAGLFVWAACPPGADGAPLDSMDFVERSIMEADVVMVPGAGFGECGRNWFRVALSVPTEQVREGMERLKRLWK